MRRLFSPYAVLQVMPRASHFFVSAYGLAFGLVPAVGGIAPRMTVYTFALFVMLLPLLVVPGVLSGSTASSRAW
ncbi:MAG: hypothetical protein V9G19_13490 [Tetrasphaera sp.]